MLEAQYVFIDEYGDPNLNISTKGASNIYILAAVSIKESKLDETINEFEKIRIKYFPGGELKSSRLSKKKEHIRLKILSEICTCEFRIFLLIVDKKRIDKGSGLQHKRSYIKFIHKLLFENLYKYNDNVYGFVDEHGSPDFMKGFKEYLDEQFPSDLFIDRDFCFESSIDNVGIQAADIIAGTLARNYDPERKDEYNDEYLKIIKEKIISIDGWPPSYWYSDYKYIILHKNDYTKIDFEIQKTVLKAVKKFILDNENSENEIVIDQIRCLNYLLSIYKFYSKDDYVSGNKIVDTVTLCKKREQQAAIKYLQTKIIAGLRDEKIIIASSNEGYKIPSRLSDIKDYINHTKNTVEPMISRLDKARKEMIFASYGEIDILNDKEYEQLRKYVECYNNFNLPS